ncbi:unnamed protein product [Orchesella dallaii]|uniref:RING-type domain-containing protein n=1 Tax=Orchesella dallaii TaxID=48710 RepID=A0ABP1REF0_9HEXA
MSFMNRNFITNPSGHDGFTGWRITKNGGDEWKIENEPVGCDKLPSPDRSFYGPETCCFATSYDWCSKSYLVDFRHNGLPNLTRLLPFKIICSQMYASRFDCGGMGKWKLEILNENKQLVLRSHQQEFQHHLVSWKQISHEFHFGISDRDIAKQIRFLQFTHEGKDDKFWSGHFGMKLARACVKIEQENPSSQEPGVDIPSSSSSSSSSSPRYSEDVEPVASGPSQSSQSQDETREQSVEPGAPLPIPHEDLRCPVCWDLPPGNIYQCKNGHTICETCVNNLYNCPQCRVPYGNDRIRNRVAEALINNIQRNTN